MDFIISESCDLPWERRLNNISDLTYMQVGSKGQKVSQILSLLEEKRGFSSIATEWLPQERPQIQECLPGTGQFSLIQNPVPLPC